MSRLRKIIMVIKPIFDIIYKIKRAYADEKQIQNVTAEINQER